MPPFYEREITATLLGALAALPVVVLTGARQVGKSTLLQQHPDLAGRRYFSLDDFVHLEAARSNPEALLAGSEPVTIDEAQKAPELLAVIQRLVDRERVPGRFLLSGSANFSLLKDVSDSLAGRALYLSLQPFTRREILRESDPVPFLRRFCQAPSLGEGRVVTEAEVLTGGLPPVAVGGTNPQLWFRGYEQTYLERDLRDLAQVADLVTFRRFLVLVALRTGQVLNVSELARDAHLNHATATRWLGLLEASFMVRRLGPFLGNRTSRLLKSPKLYLADSGLAAHLAGVTDVEVGEPLRGPLLETWVAANLAALLESHWPEARLHYWSVQGRHEVDFVIEAGRASLALEVKAATRWGSSDLTSLKAFLEATPGCRAAILGHNGTQSAQLGDRLWALPLGLLLS